MNERPSFFDFSSFSAFAAAAFLSVAPPVSTQATPFYTSAVFGPADPPNANDWSDGNKTNSSVIFEVFIDYTTVVAEATDPFTIFENGADAIGSGLAIDGEDIIFAAGGASIATTATAIGLHGLTPGQTNVQLVAVLEFGAGTDDNELLSVYVNGELVASADGPTGNDWAGANGSNLGASDSFLIFEYVPSINPNAGDGANGQYTLPYPDQSTIITFAAYELGVGDNTVENILAVPAPESLDLTITPSATTAGNYDFSWASQDGKVYDLVSSTDLSTSPSTWQVYGEDNGNLEGTGPVNTLLDVSVDGDPKRFFAVIAKEPVP